ncbi:MAG: TldD/PmbA family protein, partial [Arenimonas sp.]|nr:TldD/PmbA family protein [Arenimonas sp.]
MHRRNFLVGSGLGLTGLMIPGFGQAIAAEVLISKMDVGQKKAMADLVLNAARAAGASYCDVRIGRYLQQSILTRERKVQSITNAESTGVGIRVIAKGTWGFAATSDLSNAGIVKAA